MGSSALAFLVNGTTWSSAVEFRSRPSVATPVFVIGRRRGLRNSWAAFIPLLGIWIVLFESIGRSGWFALLVFIPTAGPIALLIWTAVQVPAHHGRSRWWTLGFIIPGVNVIGYWCYAFTLPRTDPALASP